jgi:acetylornithine deacetylase/succinyl-diaminopimelate desuccinylase-like protein
MALLGRSSAFSRVTALAELRPLHEAFRWLHLNGQQMMRWQAELVAIPGPPFGEEKRSAWMVDKFEEAGLESVVTDSIGNVFGELVAVGESVPVVLLSAHLDTVFPASTPLKPIVDGDRLEGPGACDNAAGVIGMLGIAHALRRSFGTQTTGEFGLVFSGNVGEEGEGDLRGVRRIYQDSPYSGRIAAHIVLDGAGAETAVTQALGSRRFQVKIIGPGGHSFTDAGTPNPITIMALALARMAELPLSNGPDEPRTTMNVGTISGGTSVNSIPESAVAALDFRSTDPEQLLRLEVALHRCVEDAVDAANAADARREKKRDIKLSRNRISYLIEKIGDRPAANLPHNSALLVSLRAVDRHLGLRTDLRLGSTDANIPLSLGVPAVSLGAGGDGGGAHTRGEWYSATNRELGLRRILLLALTMMHSVAGD